MKPSTLRHAYLREATIMLVVAALAVRLLPATRVFAWANRPLRRSRRFGADEVCWVAWSVETMGGKPWMNALCLPRALAAHAMLRRRGIASCLCLGVACSEDALTAHAWVEVGREVTVGGAETARFTRLTRFGGRAIRS
jgi:Transglutaminase-like superfamily